MRTRALLLSPFLLTAVLWTTASSQPDAPAASPPANLEELDQALSGLSQRFDLLVKLASTDKRYASVAMYANYKMVDFEDRKRVMTAEDMVAIWADPNADMELRTKAHEAMMEALPRNYDPDLVGRKGGLKPRNRFAEQKVVPLLEHADAITRDFAHKWLLRMTPPPSNEPAIEKFDARKSTAKEIKAAQQAWRKILKR